MTDLRDVLRRAAPAPTAALDVDALMRRASPRRRYRRLAAWIAGLAVLVGVGVPLQNALSPAGESDRLRTGPTLPPGPLTPLPGPSTATAFGRCHLPPEQPNETIDRSGRFRLTESTEFPLGISERALAVWDHYLAYAADAGEVHLCDLNSGDVRLLADGRNTVAMAGDGRRLVVTDSTGASWQVSILDIATGKASELARGSNHRSREATPPRPTLSGDWVVWTQEPADGPSEPELVVHNLSTGRQRVTRHTDLGRVSVVNETLYFDAAASGGGRTVFTGPVDGRSPAQPLTGSEGARGVHAAAGLLAWTVDDGRGSGQVWAMRLAEARPVAVGTGSIIGTGDTWVAWVEPSGISLHDGTANGAPVRVVDSTNAVAGRGAANGTLLAWITRAEGVRTTSAFTAHLGLVELS